MATKYIYSDQTGPSLPGGSPLFFRTVTIYDEDSTGKVTNTETIVYYTAKPGGRAGNGDTWTPGSSTSVSGFNPGGFVRVAVTGDKGKTFSVGNPPVPYTQADADAGRIPPGKKVGDPILGAGAIQSLTTRGGVLNEAIQNSVINVAVKTKPGLAKQLAAKLENTATPDDVQESTTTATPKPLVPGSIQTDIPDSDASKNIDASLAKADFVYPTSMRTSQQDRIKFTALSITGRTPTDTEPGKFSLGTRKTTMLGSVTLPIQPSITDSNGVDWGGANLDPITAYAAAKSLDVAAAGNITAAAANALNEAAEDFKNQPGLTQAISIYFASQAVGAQNLLSRTSGAIVNPNLELLFNGPTLRPFNFTFRLSPRSEEEAKEVKGIINFFKKAMAVKEAKSKIFLKAPNIFMIEYQSGAGGQAHKSLNKIKDCALLGCDVDYTPDGSYMTFNDEAKTMTSYQITLRFSELDPIYNTNYEGLDNEIGY